jgi:N-terminal half of MaoC dehydratase
MSTEPGPETEWNDWGPRVRVRIDASPVMILARTLDDANPVYASQAAARAAGLPGVPAPPTFTFVMTHSGAFPDLQPRGGAGSLFGAGATAGTSADDGEAPAHATTRRGLYLHGEQHFTYHRQPMVGDVLEGRMRVSKPVAREARRGPMEVTFFQTEWCDTEGAAVVTEQIVSLFFPEM